MRIELGDKVEHVVSGFVGVAVSRTEYFAKCTRIGVQGRVQKDGKLPEAQYLDEDELLIVEKKAVKLQEGERPQKTKRLSPTTGGFRPAPLGRSEPER